MCHTLERLTQVWLKVALALWYLNILQFKPLHSAGVTLHGGISKAKLCEESVISLKKTVHQNDSSPAIFHYECARLISYTSILFFWQNGRLKTTRTLWTHSQRGQGTARTKYSSKRDQRNMRFSKTHRLVYFNSFSFIKLYEPL